MTTREELSFCRICFGHCGMVLTVDDNDRLVSIRADRDDPQTLGFACFKGLQAVDQHHGSARIRTPLKRNADGELVPVPLEQALDEIGARMRAILDKHGPDAIAGYKGSGGFGASSAARGLTDFLKMFGSHKYFTAATIDQSSKIVTAGRMGSWPPGFPPFPEYDVMMLVGNNPVVTISGYGIDVRNMVKKIKDAKARGMKLIVIDPRFTETARFADLFLQPLPGEDATLFAGLIKIVLQEDWIDHGFCAEHVGDLEALRTAVAPFTPDYVAARTGVLVEQLLAAAEMFARDGRRGPVVSSTGPSMSQHGNACEHLMTALNVICGRFRRAGEPVANTGMYKPAYPVHAQVIPGPRWWEHGPKSRVGPFGMLINELPTGTLVDEILQPGPGQVRCLINHGGNPASAIPDQRKTVEALRSLDLLVSIEPFMTSTARVSDYVLPSKLHYERADLPSYDFDYAVYPDHYARFTEPVIKAPEGTEDDIIFFWGMAKRLGLTFEYMGVPLAMDSPPEMDYLFEIATRNGAFSLEELKRHPRGVICEDRDATVLEADPATAGKFALMPDDVADEVAAVLGTPPQPAAYPYRLAVRRDRDVFNSAGREYEGIRKRIRHNKAFLNPADMEAASIKEGDWVRIASEIGSIRVLAEADPDLRSGVVSVTHGFGGLPDEDDYEEKGVSVNLIIPLDTHREAINAMPRMTAVPVQITKA